MSKVVAVRDTLQVVDLGEGKARVEEPSTGYVGPEMLVGAILAKGYWDAPTVVEKGGKGSGHRGHRGRPGQVGGSIPGTGGAGRTTPQNGDEAALMDYLNQVYGMRKNSKPKGFKYAGMEDMVLKHGQFFEPPKKGDKLPKGCQKGEAKDCYRNSMNNMMMNPDDYTYVEGYATIDIMSGFGISHAWLVDKEGNVIDPTWEPGVGTSYFGIKLNKDFVLDTILRTEMAGVIVNDMFDDHKLMKDGFPEGAIDE
jgi:hypothetical protein